MIASAVASTQNEKLGDAAATYAAQVSCPSTCVFRDGGCYAETGRLGKFRTAPLNAAAETLGATALDVALAEADAIDALDASAGLPLRLHVVGDCATDETAVIVAAAAERYVARGGGQVWAYTHGWRDVARGSWGAVSVLASCETPADVELARARGYATAVVVEQFPGAKRYVSEGVSVLPCPAQTRDRSCSSCRLCFDDTRLLEQGLSIGFELHGIPFAVRQARLALRAPDDPERRIPSVERIFRFQQRVRRDEGREPSVREIAAAIDLNEASVGEWVRFLSGEAKHPAVLRRERDARRKRVAA